jgi:HEAT repeat protein
LSAAAIAKDEPQKAMPILIDALSLPTMGGDRDTRLLWESRRALQNLGNVAISPLIDALASKDSTVWSNAAALLGDMKASEATTLLVAKLKSERPRQPLDFPRQDIVKALGDIGDARAIPALLDIAHDDKESEYTQRAAIWSLAQIGGDDVSLPAYIG